MCSTPPRARRARRRCAARSTSPRCAALGPCISDAFIMPGMECKLGDRGASTSEVHQRRRGLQIGGGGLTLQWSSPLASPHPAPRLPSTSRRLPCPHPLPFGPPRTPAQVEDRPVVKERVELIQEHRPVEKEFVVRATVKGHYGGEEQQRGPPLQARDFTGCQGGRGRANDRTPGARSQSTPACPPPPRRRSGGDPCHRRRAQDPRRRGGAPGHHGEGETRGNVEGVAHDPSAPVGACLRACNPSGATVPRLRCPTTRGAAPALPNHPSTSPPDPTPPPLQERIVSVTPPKAPCE